MRTYAVPSLVALAAVVVATGSCGDVVRSSRSPSMLAIMVIKAPPTASFPTTFLSDVSDSSGTVFTDFGQAQLGVVMKNVDPSLTPTTNNQITVNRYHVSYHRADGRNTEGVDVPFGFDGAVTTTIPAGLTQSVDFELVRAISKREAPLVQLHSNPTVLTTIADVTFYGQDQVGTQVSATGSILIDFGDFQ